MIMILLLYIYINLYDSDSSYQRGPLGVLQVDLLSSTDQLLDVSQHPPLRRRPRLVDHLLGDACQSTHDTTGSDGAV